MERDKYHHGNLKQALIKESLNQLYLVGVEKFSFRTIAKNLGVVSSAPYNHFVNKEELFKELISIGTKSLMQKMHEEKIKNQAPSEKLASLAKAYLKFSLEEKELFLLMFT